MVGKVNKIYQPHKDEITLDIYNNSHYTLDISANPANCRICLTTSSKPNPTNAPSFCMLLRKYLVGGKITNISSYDLERTIEINFECYNELNDLCVRKVFVQIMSRQSNIILTNENDIIIDCIKHSENFMPAHPYIPATSTKQSFLTLQNFEHFLSFINIKPNINSNIISNANIKTNETTLVNTNLLNILTTNFIGFSKPFVENCLEELNIDPLNFTNKDLEKIYTYITQIVQNLHSQSIYLKPYGKDYVISSVSATSSISNTSASTGNSINSNSRSTSTKTNLTNQLTSSSTQSTSLNLALDNYYTELENCAEFQNRKNKLFALVNSNLTKYSKRLENINSKLDECKNMDIYKVYGELLTANLYRLNPYENLSSIDVENYYENNERITIPLDNKINLQKNIKKFFKKYNKLKNAQIIVTEQKNDTEKEIEYLETILFALENASSLDDISGVDAEFSELAESKKSNTKSSNSKAINKNNPNQKKQTQKSQNPKKSLEKNFNLAKQTINNYTVFVGKNNIQNDYLSLKFANKNDIWFHTKTIHGCHVVLKNTQNELIEAIPFEVLYECAKIAKENSKGRQSSNVEVDYCYAKYVKKPAGSKPGFVIYTNYKTINVK